MAYNARNIIVGAAAVFLTKKDSTDATFAPGLPAAVAGTPYEQTLEADAAWRHAGYTSEGLELAYEPDYTDVEVDQLLDAAKIFKTSMRASVNTTLVESQLENLLVAWGQGADSLYDITNGDATAPAPAGQEIVISAGELGDEPVERGLAAVGPAPRSADGKVRERVYFARRCISVDSVSVAARRDEATMFPVAFRLLPVSGVKAPNGVITNQYGIIRDRNLDAKTAATT